MDRIQQELREVIQYQEQEIAERDQRIQLLEKQITELRAEAAAAIEEKDSKILQLLEFSDHSSEIRQLEQELSKAENTYSK